MTWYNCYSNYNCNVSCSFHIFLISLLQQQVRNITGIPCKPLVVLARTSCVHSFGTKAFILVSLSRTRLHSLSLGGYSAHSRTSRLYIEARTRRVFTLFDLTKTIHSHCKSLKRCVCIL